VLPQGLPRREPSTSKPQPSAAQSPTPSAAITAQPARKPQPAPKPAELSAAFDTSAQTVVASAPHAPAAPAVPATHVVTSHDAFNFEPATGWAASHPPAAPARETRKRPVFVGDALDDLLGKTRELRASDVHVLANRPPMLRVAGELVIAGEPLDDATTEKLLLARVPPALHAQLRLHGSCDFSLIHPAYGRFRANVTRQRTGWKLTARPIGETVPTLAELGLPESIARATHHHQGLIVVTGPTGHGKTTTLAAIVGIINRDTTHHVITVEDPIEYVHPRAKAVISQREVGTHTKSFQAALKGSLREDPDVIVVGELRDTETVRMALTASETGHLVISTMNTPSAAKAIERLIDLFPPGDQPQVRMTLAGGLRLIISQRLLPTADRSQLCAAAEVLPGSLPLWNLIRENRTYQIASLQQRGKSLGIVRLDDSLVQLVKSGRTTLALAKEVAEAPEQVEAMVLGRPLPMAAQTQAEAKAVAAGSSRAAAAMNKTVATASAAPKKGMELGKEVLSRAGKLFGG
jgi:twitching motility protein PilT